MEKLAGDPLTSHEFIYKDTNSLFEYGPVRVFKLLLVICITKSNTN